MGALRAQPALCFADVSVEWVWASASQYPASARNESMSDRVRGDCSRGPAKIENSNKSDNEGVR